MDISRNGTKAECAEAQRIASAMTDAMPSAISGSMAVASVSMLLESTFSTCIKAEYRLAAFDDFVKYCRAQIERSCRS